MGIRYAIQISLLLALGTALTACAKPSTEYSLSSDLVRYEGVSSSGEFTQQELVRDPARSEYGQNDWVASKASASAVVKGTPGLNRVNFVFIGDGYTRAELAAYAKDVDRSVDAMLKQEPFKTYRNYFSFARVDVVSKQSGVTRANGGIVRSALGMNYGCAGLPRLLCINLEKAIKEAKNAKMHDIVFAMANSDEYGGAGYLK
ncbi:MAG: M64 family metallopeptidase, partial [Bdellovibrionota bacterium]